jgi:hypothetical protein
MEKISFICASFAFCGFVVVVICVSLGLHEPNDYEPNDYKPEAPVATHVHSLRMNEVWNPIWMRMGWQVRCRHCGEPSTWYDRVYPALQASQAKFGSLPPGWKLDE